MFFQELKIIAEKEGYVVEFQNGDVLASGLTFTEAIFTRIQFYNGIMDELGGLIKENFEIATKFNSVNAERLDDAFERWLSK